MAVEHPRPPSAGAVTLNRRSILLLLEAQAIAEAVIHRQQISMPNYEIPVTAPPPGGPSTVRGILYQMLWCLLRALRVNVTGVEQDGDGDIRKVVLRLEPRSGGDVEELGPTRRVIQLKTRSGGRTWSLSDVIVDVLPDLYKAVDLGADDSVYEFVTEAEMGRWGDVYAFFGSLRTRVPGDDPLAQLDDQTELRFAGKRIGASSQASPPFWTEKRYSQRSLFEHIVDHLRQTSAVPKNERVELTRKKMWHLLGRFKFVGGRTYQRVRGEVDSLLLALVDHPEQVREKRDALMAWLAGHATQGDVLVTSNKLLREHGLDVTPLTDWSALRQRAQALLRRELEMRQYCEAHDVRAGTASSLWESWGADTPLLGLSGESGSGKSWQLYALGLRAAEDQAITVLIDATGDADADLRRAADTFWQEIKEHGGSQPLSRIAARRKELLHKHAGQWLTILVDNVQSVQEAERLARWPVEEWGLRLAITGPPDVVAVFARAAGRRARIVPVQSFTPGQRDEYLERRLGDLWIHVRADIRDTLRRPLLAAIYCDEVAQADGWRATDEYDLFDRMWERLTIGSHGPGPFDAGHLASLAMTLLDSDPYPWPAAAVQRARVDVRTIGRLFRTGWLRPVPQERFEVPHDRLLNYAVARGLFYAHQAGEYTLDRIIPIVRKLLVEHGTYSGRRLGYVPMDLLHLLLAAGPEGEAACASILEVLDSLDNINRNSLYTDLLPTLGTRVIGLLVARLEASTGSDASLRQRPIIEGIATFDTPEPREHALRLLKGDSPDLQRAAMRILAERADPTALDRLWTLHRQMQDEPERYGVDPRNDFILYGESMAALRACVAADPDWIERALQRQRAGDPHLHDLAYLLAGLPDGTEVWARCKAGLIAKIPPDKARSIVVNVGRYRDTAEVDWLLSLIGVATDSAGAAAVRALTRIDADLAVEHVVRLPAEEMYFTRYWYLPHLLEVRREAINRKLLAHMRESGNPADPALVYAGNEDALDADTLDFLLDEFEGVLQRVVENPPPPDRHPLSWRLDLLAAINRLDLLECFRRRQGTELNRRLADFLVALGPQHGTGLDSVEREPALAVLAKIGGPEYVRVVNHYLATGHRFGRLEAIACALRCADADTIRLLGEITREDELWDDFPREQYAATYTLAALGEARLVMDACVSLGLRTPATIDEVITAPRPFDDAAVEPAIRALTADTATESQRAGAVLALGIARRSDHLSTVVALLDSVAPDSDLALACTVALGQIGDGNVLNLLARQLSAGKEPHQAHLALLEIGTDTALTVAMEHLQHNYTVEMAVNLALCDATRSEAVELITRRITSAESGQLHDALEVPIAYLDNAAIQQIVAAEPVRAALRERALGDDGTFWGRSSVARIRAIRALATFDPSTAFLAAQKALEDPDSHARPHSPYLLVEMNAVGAARVLVGQCVREESTAVRHAISRALSRVDIEADILALLDSARASERAAGCVLCGLREASEGTRLKLRDLLQDVDPDVAEVALWALRSIRRAEHAEQLAAAALVPEATREWRWVLLDALLALGDLGDEGGPRPEWLHRLEPVLSTDMREHAWKKIKSGRKKKLDELKRQDERRR